MCFLKKIQSEASCHVKTQAYILAHAGVCVCVCDRRYQGASWGEVEEEVGGAYVLAFILMSQGPGPCPWLLTVSQRTTQIKGFPPPLCIACADLGRSICRLNLVSQGP